MEKTYLKYKSPVDETGSQYWVPVVMKNKDLLVGLLQGISLVVKSFNVPPNETIVPVLGSDRFNDLLPNGKKVHEMSMEEYKDYVKESFLDDDYESHPENGVTLNYFFQVECSCGNFHGFKTVDDIPDENLICELCGKTMIDYTGHGDSEYRFEGAKLDVSKIVNELADELGLFDEDDDEADFDDEEDDW